MSQLQGSFDSRARNIVVANMSETYSQDYLDDVALELLVLRQSAPLLLSDVTGDASYDLATGKMHVGIVGNVTVGMTLEEAVERLGIRPLAFAAAWKCIDLLLEYALVAEGRSPSRGGRWTIDEKIKEAGGGHGRADPLSSSRDIWTRLLASYVAMAQVRHSLVHRRAEVNADKALVGTDQQGNPLIPVTIEEQDALIRVAQHAAASIDKSSLTSREERQFIAELDLLARHTMQPISGNHPVRSKPIRVEVPLEVGQSVDLEALRTKLVGVFTGEVEIDVAFTTRSGIFTAHLEDVPHATVAFEPDSLDWLAQP